MLRYTAFGLGISSALALPEISIASGGENRIRSGGEDVIIRRGSVSSDESDPQAVPVLFAARGEDAYIRWSGIGDVLVQGGREIIVDAVPDAQEGMVRLLILGAAMALLLHQRGLFVLHASAVALPDGACLFLGEKGQGKSTLAAALCGRGHRLISADLAAFPLTGAAGLDPGRAFPAVFRAGGPRAGLPLPAP